MNKYDISEEYGILKYISFPFNKLTIFLGKLTQTNNLLLLLNNKELSIKKEKIRTSDNKKISIYIMEPRNIKTNKVMIYYHGGAFTFKGSTRRHHLCKEYVLKGICKLIFVDYRLMPKYKYPIQLNDCYDAYMWLLENNTKLNVDLNNIIMAGDSAGGCLAADVTLKLLKENKKLPHSQMLIYPALDKRMETNSMKKYIDTPFWNTENNKKMWNYYLENKEYLSPNEHTNFKKYPTTYIETAEFDCLHDEAIEFFEKLKNANVKVILNETKKTMHGFEIKYTSITKKCLNDRIKFINNENID